MNTTQSEFKSEIKSIITEPSIGQDNSKALIKAAKVCEHYRDKGLAQEDALKMGTALTTLADLSDHQYETILTICDMICGHLSPESRIWDRIL